MTIFGGDMNLCAGVAYAQAEQNTKYLIDSLKSISNMICNWIKELEKIDKENESDQNK